MSSVLLLSNGPGELWGWARPLVPELTARGHRTTIAILPCPFASGSERRIAETLGAQEILGPAGTLATVRSMLGGRMRADVVVQLGGDLLWGRLAAWRAGAPLLCYSYGRKKGLERCRAVFTAYHSMAEAMSGAVVIGDLVAEGLGPEEEAPAPGAEGSPVVAFFPGSRDAYRSFAEDFIAEVADLLRGQFPSLSARVVLSPFAPEGDEARWRERGLLVVRGGGREAVRGVDLAVTQPGTNTLDLTCCHPLDRALAQGAGTEASQPSCDLPGLAQQNCRAKRGGRVLRRYNGLRCRRSDRPPPPGRALARRDEGGAPRDRPPGTGGRCQAACRRDRKGGATR